MFEAAVKKQKKKLQRYIIDNPKYCIKQTMDQNIKERDFMAAHWINDEMTKIMK